MMIRPHCNTFITLHYDQKRATVLASTCLLPPFRQKIRHEYFYPCIIPAIYKQRKGGKGGHLELCGLSCRRLDQNALKSRLKQRRHPRGCEGHPSLTVQGLLGHTCIVFGRVSKKYSQ